jgi:hypothetical protein
MNAQSHVCEGVLSNSDGTLHLDHSAITLLQQRRRKALQMIDSCYPLLQIEEDNVTMFCPTGQGPAVCSIPRSALSSDLS